MEAFAGKVIAFFFSTYSQCRASVRWVLDVELDAPRPLEPLTEDATTLLFQAVREPLFNVRKHACVDGARVKVRESDPLLRIVVSDRGKGFESAATSLRFVRYDPESHCY